MRTDLCRVLQLTALALLSAACSASAPIRDLSDTSQPVESVAVNTLVGSLSYEIIATYPHDPNAFTQGLELDDGILIESTGLYGESDRRRVDLESGEILSIERVEDEKFAEGLTESGGQLIQLTWQSGQAIVSDAATLAELSRFEYEGEGWGICNSELGLFMSNGSANLTLRSPTDFSTISQIEVVRDDTPVERLNELECVNGQVFANVWQTNEIVLIDPESGNVVASLDLAELVPEGLGDPGNDVLNGIAYRAETDTFLVTGKRWPVLYELKLTNP